MTTIRPARGPDEPRIRELVSTAGLPDVDPGTRRSAFVVAERNGDVVGCGGVEFYEVAGLVRSVVVAESAQGSGIGRRIVGHLEAEAFDAGLSAVYLLTMDAAGFFERLGYESVDREGVPEDVASTEQFTSQCPATADCLYKAI